MAKCKFCGVEIVPGTGKMLIMNDGKILYFCSNRCQKNALKLNRKPRNTKWTAESKELRKTPAKTE